MTPVDRFRRSFLTTSAAFMAIASLMQGLLPAQAEEAAGPLFAYVGTFSSALRDVLPTQVDLPPGNGRGIHSFQVDRVTGALTPAGVHEMGNSPSCPRGERRRHTTVFGQAKPTVRARTRKARSAPSPSIGWAANLEPLNTVRSGGAGPHLHEPVSIRPDGFVLVANYFGGSVADTSQFIDDGRLGDATDVKTDNGTGRPHQSDPMRLRTATSPISGHDRTHAHMIQGRPVRPVCCCTRIWAWTNFSSGSSTRRNSTC